MDYIRVINVTTLLTPVLYLLVCVCDNRSNDVMSKYSSQSLHWRVDGTIGEFKTNSIYYVVSAETNVYLGGKLQLNCEVVSSP